MTMSMKDGDLVDDRHLEQSIVQSLKTQLEPSSLQNESLTMELSLYS